MQGKQFWVDTLGKGWAMELKETLKSPYMKKLMNFISVQYAMNDVKPYQRDMFNAFKLCPWESLRIVIIGREPHISSNPNGLAFANHETSVFNNSSVCKIFDCLEKEYYEGSFYLDFDFELKHWARQGVLLLNRSLTVKEGAPGSHKKPWGKFNSAVLNSVNESKPATIFILWGKQAQALEPHIKKHNYVLKFDSPDKYAGTDKEWNCPNFKEADKILIELNNEKIKW